MKKAKNIKNVSWKEMEASVYVRINGDYYERVKTPDINGKLHRKLISVSRQTIVDDHSSVFLKSIKKYSSSVNIPSYINYQQEISGCFNWFLPLEYELKEGEFKTCIKLMKHIFGKQFEMGLDYLKLLYTRPLQNVPILVLVSKEQHTGKTTFLDFLNLIFGNNMIIISTADIEGTFNRHYATKHIIAVDESDLHKQNTTSKIKQIATQKKSMLNGKYQKHIEVDFFGRLILLSNNERTFVNIKEEDIRYWVRKVHPFKKFDPKFFKKITKEIPAFMHHIVNRKLSYPKSKSRTWFAEKDYVTIWAKEAKEENKSELYFEIREGIENYFSVNSGDLIVCAGDLQRNFLNSNPKYSKKWIARCFRDEFKVESEHKRMVGTYSDEKKLLGHWFVIDRKMFDSEDEKFKIEENEDELPF